MELKTIFKVLVACECSGVVREEFRRLGHDAWSCDIQDAVDNSEHHYKCDVKEVINNGWDLMIAHPPCTYFSNAGARWFYDERYPNRYKDREEALEFVKLLASAPIKHIAIENPVGTLSKLWKPPTQYIQPFQFGHTVSKKTGLWLKDLPPLIHTEIVEPEYMETSTGKRFSKWFWESSILPAKKRSNFRSKTFLGIAKAMAEQWSEYCLNQESLS